MSKDKPLWERLYRDEVYTEITRIIGYTGCYYRELAEKLHPLRERFGKVQVESAAYHVVTFEGQMTCTPKPLAEVRLRAEVRQLAWQLLGPPPESPEWVHYRQPQPWVPPWARPAKPEPSSSSPPEEPSGEVKKKRSKRKAS
jgi:hypothetical protein